MVRARPPSKKLPRRNRVRRRNADGPPGNFGPHPYATYAQLIQDPCNGPTDLQHRYKGEQGFIQRFVSDGTFNTTAGVTSGFICFHPNSGSVVTFAAPTSSTTTPITLASYVLGGGVPGPGTSYLAGAADKTRTYAACLQAYPSAVSITNLVGEYAVGCVSMSTTFGTVSADSFFTLLAGRGAMTKKKTEIKWFPGGMDDRYMQYNVNTTIDPSDTNVIVLAYRGYVAAAALSIRLTNVVEWTPKAAIGIAPTQTTTTPLPHDAIIASVHNKNPGWIHNLESDLSTAASGFVGGLAKDVASAGRYAARKGMSYGLSRLENMIIGGSMALV